MVELCLGSMLGALALVLTYSFFWLVPNVCYNIIYAGIQENTDTQPAVKPQIKEE